MMTQETNTSPSAAPAELTLSTIIVGDQPWRVNVPAMVKALKDRGIKSPLKEEMAAVSDIAQSGAVVDFDGISFAVLSLTSSLPLNQLAYGPAPNPLWPDPLPVIEGHKGHIRVVALDAPRSRTLLVRTIRLLQLLTAAICEVGRFRAVLWCPSDNLLPADSFVSFVYSALERNVDAMEIIVRLVFRTSDDGVALATHGIAPIAGREIEFAPVSPSAITGFDLVALAYGLAKNLFLGASDFQLTWQHGEWIGRGLQVELVTSGNVEEGPVYLVHMRQGS